MIALDWPDLPKFTIITGLSGAGRSEAAKNLEDLGYFVIDNLPPALIARMASLVSGLGIKVKEVALVVDVRGGEFFDALGTALADLEASGIRFQIVFLDASDEILVRRFEETRRKHPLGGSILDGIRTERRRLFIVASLIWPPFSCASNCGRLSCA